MSPETPIKHRATRELLKGHLLGRGAAWGGETGWGRFGYVGVWEGGGVRVFIGLVGRLGRESRVKGGAGVLQVQKGPSL